MKVDKRKFWTMWKHCIVKIVLENCDRGADIYGDLALNLAIYN